MRVSYRWIETPAHVTLTIWVDGASAGNLTVRRGAEETVLGAIVAALKAMPGVPVSRIEA